jgi:hypothetical protein
MHPFEILRVQLESPTNKEIEQNRFAKALGSAGFWTTEQQRVEFTSADLNGTGRSCRNGSVYWIK